LDWKKERKKLIMERRALANWDCRQAW